MTIQSTMYEEKLLEIIRRLPIERIFQVVDFANSLIKEDEKIHQQCNNENTHSHVSRGNATSTLCVLFC
ncbi:MAG: hypothetical protein HQK76_00770, partial [Desulfobacterales bacterium]|nr:hypothetical protein [Desulfobacterales bacterium]